MKLDSDDAVSPQTCFGKGDLKVVVSAQTHHTTVFVSLEGNNPPLAKKAETERSCQVINSGYYVSTQRLQEGFKRAEWTFCREKVACCVKKYE